MAHKVTFQDVQDALDELKHYLPDENLRLDRWGCKVQIQREDHSTPFGYGYNTYAETLDLIWFAVTALRLAHVERRK